MLQNLIEISPPEPFPVSRPEQGRRRAWRRRLLAGAVALGIGANLGAFLLFPPAALARRLPDGAGVALARARQTVYGMWVDLQRDWALSRLPPYYEKIDLSPFTVYFPPGEREAARVAARVARRHLAALEEHLGVRATAPVPLVISPTAQDLAGRLDGRRGVLGAYWRGVVWVLSPRQWLDASGGDWEREFEVQGPVVHELTHWLMDRKAAGNLPAWFDEGVAQYVEFTLTGYQWLEPANRLDQPLYSLAALTGRFDRLSNEALAYRQAFLLVRALAGDQWPGALRRISDDLARGIDLAAAVRRATGRDLTAIGPAAWQESSDGQRNGYVTNSE